MRFKRRQALALLAGTAAVPLLNATSFAQIAVKPDEKTITEAYIYLLGRVLVIRQENMDRSAPGFAYNTIKYNPIGEAG
jgi:hypothetical protein